MIDWSPRGKQRLKECARYIAEECLDRLTVLNWIDNVYEKIEPLEEFPRIGNIAREIGRDDIREVMHGDYRIIYRVKRNKPEIISIRHGHFLIRSIHSL